MALAAMVALGILAFHAARLGMALPIFAGDEAAFLIRALFNDQMVARNPFVQDVSNGVHLSVIRAVYQLGGPYIVWDRVVNSAAYLGGLVLIWRWAARRLPALDQAWLLLLAVAFPYYPFAFSNLAEGLFAGVVALVAVATGWLYLTRPKTHALVAGVLCAALVLTKPHGVAVIAALLLTGGLEAAISRRWGLLAVRVSLFAVAFFTVGNVIQIGAEAPAANPLTFFVGRFYEGQIAVRPPPGVEIRGLAALGSMIAASAVLAGAPILIGLADIGRRRRTAAKAFALEGADLVFLLLVGSLAATLPMVTVFVMKIAGTLSETGRLWGRYFEVFAPMIWLAAAPAMARTMKDGPAWLGPACGGLMVVALVALLALLNAGIVLFPWDSSVLMAFFAPDPTRAALPVVTPYRALATLATLLAAAGLALRVRPAAVGAGLILALGVLATNLDHIWLGPLVAQRADLDRDLTAIAPTLPKTPGATLILAPDANEGHLAFLRLDALPRVILGPPARASAAELAGAQAIVVAGPDAPTGPDWTRTYRGAVLSVFRPAAAP